MVLGVKQDYNKAFICFEQAATLNQSGAFVELVYVFKKVKVLQRL